MEWIKRFKRRSEIEKKSRNTFDLLRFHGDIGCWNCKHRLKLPYVCGDCKYNCYASPSETRCSWEWNGDERVWEDYVKANPAINTI